MSPSLVFELPDKLAPVFSIIMALDPVLDFFVVYAKKKKNHKECCFRVYVLYH